VTCSRRNGSKRNNEWPAVRALLLAVAVSVALDASAAAQQNTAPSTGATVKPRGQRDVKDVIFGDWKKLCFKPGGAKRVCRTSIAGFFPTGQMAVRLDITEREGDTARRLQIFCPVGMYLQTPVELTVDQGRAHRVPYTWCLTNACIAGAVADPLLMDEMDKGRTLRLQFVDSALLSLTTSVSLNRFSVVYGGAPAQTFEQDIDE
jgi:invasion protein IalB